MLSRISTNQARLCLAFFFFLFFTQDFQFKVQRRREEINIPSGQCAVERSFHLLVGKRSCHQLLFSHATCWSEHPISITYIFFSQLTESTNRNRNCWSFKSILQFFSPPQFSLCFDVTKVCYCISSVEVPGLATSQVSAPSSKMLLCFSPLPNTHVRSKQSATSHWMLVNTGLNLYFGPHKTSTWVVTGDKAPMINSFPNSSNTNRMLWSYIIEYLSQHGAAEFSADAAQPSVQFCFLLWSFTGPLAAEPGGDSPDVTRPSREVQSLANRQWPWRDGNDRHNATGSSCWHRCSCSRGHGYTTCTPPSDWYSLSCIQHWRQTVVDHQA